MRIVKSLPLFGFALLSILSLTVIADETLLKGIPMKGDISLDPLDPIWQKIPSTRVGLMPQVLFVPRGGGATKEVMAQVLYTKMHLYLRLTWQDATRSLSQDVHRTEMFDDAVAVQFPLYPREEIPSPFMGDQEHPVNIWQWKASWQEMLEMAQAHPRTVQDVERDVTEPIFRTGEAVGNLFSQRKRSSPVENLIASGFGTLTTTKVQPVEGRGVFREGRWHLVMRRQLLPQDKTVEADLRNVKSIPIAFAVWDGAQKERNGIKSVSIWGKLLFEYPKPWWKSLSELVMQRIKPTPTIPLVTHGRDLFKEAGCMSCHGPSGRGGIRNLNAGFGQEVPPLTDVARIFSKEELIEKIRQGSTPAKLDPQGPNPERTMPSWHLVMSDEDHEALAAYLMSLISDDETLW